MTFVSAIPANVRSRTRPATHHRARTVGSTNIGFRKNDNAFLAVDDVAALQAAADRLTPDIIRKRLDYWTFILGPKFSAKERRQVKLSRTYAVSQVEYCFKLYLQTQFSNPQAVRAKLLTRSVAADRPQD
jgi:hypothetical protein